MTHRLKLRLAVAIGAAMLIASLSAGAVLAGEITGNGKLKDVNGRSECAFSGQEDLQWFFDDLNTRPIPPEDVVKGEPSHAQSWGQIPKAVRDGFPPEMHPSLACNPAH
jgi:hypothetical protein